MLASHASKSPVASPSSRQAEGLRRWLSAQPAPATAPETQKITTLRQALAREGLAILPDPLHRFPTMKVVQVDRLLRETAFLG